MNLYTAMKTGRIGDRPLAQQQLHVLTPDGRLGTVEVIRYNDARSVFMVRLGHFNGEPFDHEYAAGTLELLSREER